ncbi:hypothetical protein [Streptomyces sp. NPDC020362]|uniref:hypothetical protein n=1 Tax=unclassified Streptomyces TaxID=2593676 RepID=UPI0033EC4622
MVDAALRGEDDIVDQALARPMAAATGMRWFVRNGMWAFDADSHGELLRKTRGYTLRGVAQQISCPCWCSRRRTTRPSEARRSASPKP